MRPLPRGSFQCFLLLSDALVQIRHAHPDLLLDSADHFFLRIRKLKEVLIHGIGAAAEYLSQLLRAEKLFLLDKPGACGEILLGGIVVLHEIVPVYHARAVIVPIPCDELNAVFARRTCQHRAAKVSEDTAVAIQSAGFELRGSLHSGHILQRLRGDVLDAI